MKAFKITDSLGNVWEGSKTSFGEAASLCTVSRLDSVNSYNYFLYGKEVSAEGFADACEAVREEKRQRKLLTHKEILIPDGYIGSVSKKYRPVWVKK